MMTNAQLTQSIMRRVWLIYCLRRLTRPFMLKAYAFCGAALAAFSFVSLTNVFYNMPSVTDIYGTYTFWTNAVLYTETHVQLLLLFAVAAFVVFAYDLVRSVTKLKIQPLSVQA